MKTITTLVLFFCLPLLSFGWGAEGHKMVATIAKKNLKKGVEAKVQKYLGTMSFEDAATWMDDIRNDHTYDYQKPWHYVNIDSGATYQKNPKGDVAFVLDSIIKELKNYKKLKDETVAMDLKILFHLCGDIAQPLHAGYGKDLGGNSVKVDYNGKPSNLHKVWDSEIIRDQKISVDDCTTMINGWSSKQKKTIQKIKPMDWMKDSRSLLPKAYGYTGTAIPADYITNNKVLIEQQIAKGGLRLASVLNSIFG